MGHAEAMGGGQGRGGCMGQQACQPPNSCGAMAEAWASRLASHARKAQFINTVLNILLVVLNILLADGVL